MFHAILRRIAPVFAVVFGMLAFSISAEARSEDRLPSAFEVQAEKQFQTPAYVGTKQHVRKKAYVGKKAHIGRKAYVSKKVAARKKALAQKRAYYRNKALRQHHAYAGVHPRSKVQAPVSATPRVPGSVEARVDLKSQRMVVKINGEVAHVWKVSTARKGFITPRGVYGPQRMHVTYFSKKYYNAPMPYAIFFKGGYAVHGTGAVKALGAPASHGCIRLATGNARALFHLVKQFGPGKARIVIS